MKRVNTSKPFNITSVCKDDILGLERQDKTGNIIPMFKPSIIKKLTDSDMERIASKLADDYCEQFFWSSLRIITEYVIESKRL